MYLLCICLYLANKVLLLLLLLLLYTTPLRGWSVTRDPEVTEMMLRYKVSTVHCDICVSQITMTTGWLLLLMVVVSFHVVDSQSTTDGEACDGGVLSELKIQMQLLLQLQTFTNRLGKQYSKSWRAHVYGIGMYRLTHEKQYDTCMVMHANRARSLKRDGQDHSLVDEAAGCRDESVNTRLTAGCFTDWSMIPSVELQ